MEACRSLQGFGRYAMGEQGKTLIFKKQHSCCKWKVVFAKGLETML
jgi:hypothetical protein